MLSTHSRLLRLLPLTPQNHHPITTATIIPPLLLQDSSSRFQLIEPHSATLIYIQVKDTKDGVRNPVAMVTGKGRTVGDAVLLEGN